MKIRLQISQYWEKLLIDLKFESHANIHTGTKRIVEIDESKFGKKCKQNRGKQFERDWIFGMVDTRRNMMILKMVDKRDTPTLLPIIQKHIDHSYYIHHDDWAVYRNLNQHGYSHSTVVHTREFVAEDGTHTNGMEGMWGAIKQRLARMHGYTHSRLQVFMNEECFRYLNKGNMLPATLNALAY